MPAIFTDDDCRALRRSMLDAGWACLLEHGYRATRVEDIAREAGVATGTFYKLFPSKGDFVASMVTENRRALVAELEEFLARMGRAPRRAELRDWMRAAWHGGRAIFRFIDIGDYRKICGNLPEDVNMGPELTGSMLSRIAEALAADGIAPDTRLAASLQRVCALVLLQRADFDPAMLESIIDALIDATLDALYGRREHDGEGKMEHAD